MPIKIQVLNEETRIKPYKEANVNKPGSMTERGAGHKQKKSMNLITRTIDLQTTGGPSVC